MSDLPEVSPDDEISAHEIERERERSREVFRENFRFWSRVVATLLLCVAVYLGAQMLYGYLMTTPRFEFRQLELTGDISRVPADRVKKAVEPALQGNFFSTSLSDVRRAAEEVPWVRSATVRRIWPDKLLINVKAYRAAALYEDGRLVSAEGELFAANPEERANPNVALPNFYGPASQVALITRYWREFSRALTPIGTTVTDVTLSDRGGWSLVMASADIPPTRIDLGQETKEGSVVQKLCEMAAAYPRVVELMDGPPGSIDLRYRRAFAATLPDREAMEKLHAPAPNNESAQADNDTENANE